MTVSAPGKVNLFFAVGAKQADGFHDVVSVYFALNLRERVTVAPADSYAITVEGLSRGVPTDESNLAIKAAKAVSGTPVHIHIDKSVPVAGGMGGGSADAAAVVVAMSKLESVSVDPESFVSLGADVPFAIKGGVALGLGRGEKLTELACSSELHIVLVPAKFGLSTPLVYQTLDEIRPEASGAKPDALIEALRTGDAREIANYLHNDLQQAALHIKPELQKTIDWLEQLGALKAMVSGSGPTVLALCESAEVASRIAAATGGIATTGPVEGAI